MQFSKAWLQEFFDKSIDKINLGEVLTMAGLEVDTIQDLYKLSNLIVVGEITNIEKHPDADRLNICKVNIGLEKTLKIVCGAPNARIGIKVPCALIGAKLQDFEIKKDSINFIKRFDTEIGSFGLGFSYSSINASTESFSEILNNTNNDYALQDVNFNFYTPHFEYSKRLSFGLNAIKLGFSLKRSEYKKNNLKMNVSLDVSNEVLTLDEELGLSNDSSTTLFINNTYSKSLFAELSYSQKEDNKMTQLRFGYLF